MGSVKNYKVVGTVIRHNHKRYKPGDIISLEDIEAESLKAYLITETKEISQEIKTEKTKKGDK